MIATIGPLWGAVLVGGASSRMGSDKATMPYGAAPMASLVIEVLRTAGCKPVIVVGASEALHGGLGARFVTDRHPGAGPLGALITALHASAATTAVVACDMPLLTPATVVRLAAARAAHAAAAAIALTVQPEPLLAVWAASALEPLERAFDAGVRAIRDAIIDLDVVTVPVDAREARNLNTPDDLRC